MYSAGDANRLGLQKAIQARKQKNREEGKTVFGNKDEIGVSEFKDIVYSLGYSLSDAQVAIAVSTLDTDGSGAVSFDEFYAWWTKDDKFEHLQLDERQTAAVQAASAYFQFFDKDQSGMIDEQEFKALFEDLSARGGYFVAGTTLQQALKEVKGKASTEKEISFNDYVFWLLQKGCITHFQI